MLASPASRPRPGRLLAFAAALALALGGCASAPPAPTAEESRPSLDGEPIASALALATFDSAWSRINSSYYDPDFRGLDWPGVRDELRPAAAEAATRGELRRVLRDMLSRLGESHFAIFPEETVDQISVDDEDGEPAGAGETGLELRWVEGRLTVFRADSAARAAGIGPGWIVEAIGEREMDRWRTLIAEAESETARRGLQTQTLQAASELMGGPVGSSARMRVRGADDVSRTLDVPRHPVRGEMVQFGQLPAMAAHLEFERLPAESGCVGVVRFNIWMVPLVPEFNRAVDRVADCVGVIVDIRGNPGGVGGMVMSTAGSFFDERAELGIVQSRAGEIRFVAMPRGVDTDGRLREAFAGRLAVLIDEMSMSTSEIFAAGLKSSGRARLFGTTTPGYALPAMTIRLPSGDVLYHVISNLTDPDGRRIEGQGVAPDVPVPLSRAALLAGRDPALEAAAAWAAGGV